jgi:hypothetical protein
VSGGIAMNNKYSHMTVIVSLVVIILTIGCLMAVGSMVSSSLFWTCLVDIVIMEIIAAIYFIYGINAVNDKFKPKFPLAILISMQYVSGVIFVCGLIVDVLFLVLFNSGNYDVVFLIVTLVRWLVLIVILSILWITGKMGTSETIQLETSMDDRRKMLNKLQQVLSDINHVNLPQEDYAIKQQISNEIETLYNMSRSRLSASSSKFDNSIFDGLLNELTISTSELLNIPIENRNSELMKIQNILRQMSRNIIIAHE